MPQTTLLCLLFLKACRSLEPFHCLLLLSPTVAPKGCARRDLVSLVRCRVSSIWGSAYHKLYAKNYSLHKFQFVERGNQDPKDKMNCWDLVRAKLGHLLVFRPVLFSLANEIYSWPSESLGTNMLSIGMTQEVGLPGLQRQAAGRRCSQRQACQLPLLRCACVRA